VAGGWLRPHYLYHRGLLPQAADPAWIRLRVARADRRETAEASSLRHLAAPPHELFGGGKRPPTHEQHRDHASDTGGGGGSSQR